MEFDGLTWLRTKIKRQVVLLAVVRTPYLVLHVTGGAIRIHTRNHADPLILTYEIFARNLVPFRNCRITRRIPQTKPSRYLLRSPAIT
jgi:hypothetical protein